MIERVIETVAPGSKWVRVADVAAFTVLYGCEWVVSKDRFDGWVAEFTQANPDISFGHSTALTYSAMLPPGCIADRAPAMIFAIAADTPSAKLVAISVAAALESAGAPR